MAKKKVPAPTELSHLAPNPKNPRRISDEKLEDLQRAVVKFGDLGGVWFNRQTGRLGGGHQRAKVLPEKSKIEIIKRLQKPDRVGTVAYGYIVTPEGDRFSYREVDWDTDTETAANIAANKHGGEWDEDLLSESLAQLDDELLEFTGFDDLEMERLLRLEPTDKYNDSDYEEAKKEWEEASGEKMVHDNKVRLIVVVEDRKYLEEISDLLKKSFPLKVKSHGETVIYLTNEE